MLKELYLLWLRLAAPQDLHYINGADTLPPPLPPEQERAALDAKDYAMWSLDRFRLSLIDNLSTFVSTLFSVFVLIVLAGIGAMFFAAALTWLLGMLIGSMLAAILIMGGLFVLLALIVYGRRKRLILNQTVRMFSRMMSDLGDKYSDDE